jgi:mitochondrial fission protein ELM1
MAGISMALKARAKQQGAQLTTIHLQDPRLDPAYFDILIVPHHDPARG